MNLETSKKVLKVFGILAIIGGIFFLLISLLALFGGAALTTVTEPDAQQASGYAFELSFLMLISGIVFLLEGIFSLKAVKDATKAQPAWILAIISIVIAVIDLISTIVTGQTSNLFSHFCNLVTSIVVFIAVNNIKKSVTESEQKEEPKQA